MVYQKRLFNKLFCNLSHRLYYRFSKILVMSNKDRVFIFDTTMRDGEQSPGASMSLEEKIQIARVFDELGIDIIEAGFPIASPGDFEAVSEVSKILKNSIPAGLSRHSVKDIDRAYEALKHAPRFRIHTFISTSPLHMKHKLNMSPEDVYESIGCLLYTSPSPRDRQKSRMPSSA